MPGDRIGYENEHITAYNKDGLLLQMGDSMKPIDESQGFKDRNNLVRTVRESPKSGSSRFWRISSWEYRFIIFLWRTIRIAGKFHLNGAVRRPVCFTDRSWIHDFYEIFLE